MSPELYQLVGIPQDSLEEVALVPCGGCSKGRLEAFSKLLEEAGTSLVGISLQSIACDVPMSVHRLRAAFRLIGLSACEQDCVSRLVKAVRVPDVSLIASRIGDRAALTSRLRQELGRIVAQPVAVQAKPSSAQPPPIKVASQENKEGVHRLDCRNLRAPMPILEITRFLANHHEPTILEVVSNDPAFSVDIKHWCDHSGAKLERVEADGNDVRAFLAVNQPSSVSKVEKLPAPPPRPQAGGKVESEKAAHSAAAAKALAQVAPSASAGKASRPIEQPSSRRAVPETKPSVPPVVEDLPEIDMTLDCRQMRCPKPLLTLASQARKTPNAVIQVLATDPAFHPDVTAWSKTTGAIILSMTKEDGEYKAIVRAKKG